MGEHATWWSSHWLSLQGLLMICLASLLSEYLFQQSLQGLLIISFAFLSEHSFQKISFYTSQELQMLSGVTGDVEPETTNWY